jgi:hypothetical protein
MENQWCMWSDGSGPLKRKWLFLSPQEGWDCHTHIASFLPLNSVAMSLLRALDAIPQSLSSGLGADSARFTQSSEAHFFPVIKQSLSCSPWLRLKCENHCENMLQVRKRLPYVMWGTCGVPCGQTCGGGLGTASRGAMAVGIPSHNCYHFPNTMTNGSIWGGSAGEAMVDQGRGSWGLTDSHSMCLPLAGNVTPQGSFPPAPGYQASRYQYPTLGLLVALCPLSLVGHSF